MTRIPILLFWFLSFALVGVPSLALAQQNFVTLKEGEYQIDQAPRPHIEDAVITGRFEADYLSDRSENFSSRTGTGQAFQDIELGFDSNLHDHISIVAKIANNSRRVADQPQGYQSYDTQEQGDSTADTGLNLIFKEAFLEYNHNPSAVLRLGRQRYSIGDKKGLVYQGWANGFSQTCGIGTWCYLIGAARIGQGVTDNLLFAQLTYPIYENGVEHENPWGEPYQESAFYVEIFRNFHQGSEMPLALYGGRTGAGSSYQVQENGRGVYYDNKKLEYFGTNLNWRFYGYHLDLNYVAFSGRRNYWSGARGEADRQYLTNQHLAGAVWLVNQEFLIHNDWKLGFEYLLTRASEHNGDAYYAHDRVDFVEIKKGTFGDALIYFDGEGLGQGHGVTNLNYRKLDLHYKNPVFHWGLDFALWGFNRDKAVANQTGEKYTKIGNEFDFKFSYPLDKNLTALMQMALFNADRAYSPNDNLAPVNRPQDFSTVGLRIGYHF
ncbi:MAG: hypothetical protein A2508_06365 [Candidatus Lambdaproteobacteria bacterium RIFOXYD12_FULL_49_8]|uniref:Porin n=1 Tax=Candidatus Lambdaproteobacteria bacterium RIFOXYD2_FULL_50_16 TaxID=1817772 RepID=A0A1F6GB33_9PROT|nr:MAG: hypothetical protein A2527_07305 [Candidatus Lambdaproteobacteria bacterium RIFOXYD2_FULL_50_16]OGG97590.1 MAG: hypothetical protein A2508_06365 [Candidatus Lambdaproteobacteria bacterium RIFOXYD12_FULL_49_8]